LFVFRGIVLGFWTSSIMLLRQAFYHFSHTSGPFCFGYFGDRVSLFAWDHPELQSSYLCFPP
jgi:hypothetical protein